ncbi:Coq4 family protein [Urechidicola croceus]|uniref:Coenzyme Q (Ubiquinone) biosynthesis protein Coq4 n=1 Tax=Urechidicola croceus TaxID=1850246 RepID=A0A1D8PB20_9FLAO|nr:Coq4 family protein [Urechidicola croceus]AOW21747.1 hypothetical protein LPB138_14135 [Urechidicola croceus]
MNLDKFILLNKRKKIVEWLFYTSEKIYTKYFKKNAPWGITKKDLLQLPENSFGNSLGKFLEKHNFDLIPKVERHDAYHIITGFGTNAEDEIALQYLCFGNGKRSKYLFAVIIIGTIIIPDYFKYYIKSYIIGTEVNTFHNFNYKKLLLQPTEHLKSALFTDETRLKLNQLHYENTKK